MWISSSLSFASLAVIGSVLATQPALAQDSDTGASEYDRNVIIVTARKTGESDLDVPIAIQAFGAEQLERQGIQNLQDVAASTPSLTIASGTGTTGGSITLRGVGTPAAGAGPDQAVAINLDGVTVADGMAVRLGQFDMARVEVLQGPQSLYYGKNSSGGVISIVSADPTDNPYAMLRAGYGFEAREVLTEAVLSGPLAEGLGARLAFFRSDMKGYFTNPLARDFALAMPTQTQLNVFGPLPRASHARAPERQMTGMRGTLKYDSDALSVRLKGTWMKQNGASSWETGQLFSCPSGNGIPAPAVSGNVAGIGDCELNHDVSPIGASPPSTVTQAPLSGDGHPYMRIKQWLLSGNIDYKLADGITLSSITGYYDLEVKGVDLLQSAPYPGIAGTDASKRTDFQQELRLSTDLDIPLNGMLGVYYQNGDYNIDTTATIGTPGGFAVLPILPEYWVDSRTYAVFGQLTYDFTDQFQLAAGGRYSDEKRDLQVFSLVLNRFVEDLMAVKSVRSKKFTPEVTFTYKPNPDTNLFVTYKKGTKSGGFSLPAINAPPYNGDDLSFRDENAQGIEGGIKTLLIGGALRFDLTGYWYKYKDLQVTTYDPVALSTGTVNAARMKTYGVQLNANYSPRTVPGFNIGASINYGHARFSEYLAPCWIGQTISAGCDLDGLGNPLAPGATSGGLLQDLSGRQPTAAPDWAGNIRANYDFPISAAGTMLGVSFIANYSDSFESLYSQPVNSRQKSYANLDATLRLFNDDKGWELALIGKNLTDQLRARWAVESPGSPGVAPGTGTSGPGTGADLLAITNAPRTIMLRLTLKPFAGR